MSELNYEKIDQIMHKETPKTEDLLLILRGIYLRLVRLFERYYADIDALNDDRIDELKQYHEETISLVKYYYMDIPLDILYALGRFDGEHVDKMLGSGWNRYLFEAYKDFVIKNRNENKSNEDLKAEFAGKNLMDFYRSMDNIFRVTFGTSSKTVENAGNWIGKLLFGGGNK